MASGLSYVLEWGDWIGEGYTLPDQCTVGAVAKRSSKELPYVVANELICARLGMMAGVPVVPGVLLEADTDGEPAYLSLRFGAHNERPPPVIPTEAVRLLPKKSAMVAAFDMWICNRDRHDENVAMKKRGGHAELLAFDHDRALLGTVGTQRLLDLANEPVAEGCLVDSLTSGLDLVEAAKRMSECDSWRVHLAITPAVVAGLLVTEQARQVATS